MITLRDPFRSRMSAATYSNTGEGSPLSPLHPSATAKQVSHSHFEYTSFTYYPTDAIIHDESERKHKNENANTKAPTPDNNSSKCKNTRIIANTRTGPPK